MTILILVSGLVAVVLVFAGFFLVRLSRTQDRGVFLGVLALVIVGLLYFMPKMIEAALKAYRAGVQIRQEQGR